MSIRFTCTACRTVMKLGEMIAEERKVRCSGCGMVILVTPHPSNPLEVTTSIPKRHEKPKGMSDAQRKALLVGTLLVLGVVIGVGLWWTLAGPQVRAAIEGDVTLDGAPLQHGMIHFEPNDKSKGDVVKVPIEKGHYKVSANRGPYIGMNRIRIFGNDTEIVAAQFNTDSTDSINIQAGSNTRSYATVSR